MYTDWRPLISVIIPIYNAEPYLEQCIRSVIGQTYENLDIILVDDGSTDKSSVICDRYAADDSRIKVVHKKNEGLVCARKTGILQAIGEYITYVDADDWIDLDAYETVLQKVTRQDVDMILYGMVEEYEDGCVEKKNLCEEGYYTRQRIRNQIYPQMLSQTVFYRSGILPNLVCKLTKRELAGQIQPMVNDELEMGEDADCTFQMLLQAESLQIIHLTPYHYRKRHDSMVWNSTDFSQIKSLYRDLKKAFEQSAQREVLMPQLYSYMLFILLLKAAERFMEQEAFAGRFFHKRIVLYGAGGFGQEMYRVLTEKKPGAVVLWADQRYETYREQGLPVGSPEEITECEYDLVFIAVLDTQVCEKIAESLTKQGVDKEKISYIEPDERYVEMLISILEAEGTD